MHVKCVDDKLKAGGACPKELYACYIYVCNRSFTPNPQEYAHSTQRCNTMMTQCSSSSRVSHTIDFWEVLCGPTVFSLMQ